MDLSVEDYILICKMPACNPLLKEKDEVVESATLHFFAHNELQQITYAEILSEAQFFGRLVECNKRVRFPVDSTRYALMAEKPSEASMLRLNETSALVTLKYKMSGAPAPLKWEWKVRRIPPIVFYRDMLVHSQFAVFVLNDSVSNLRLQLIKKDRELQQYKAEGKHLNRSTLATPTFDAVQFVTEHRVLFAQSRGACEMAERLKYKSPLNFGAMPPRTIAKKPAEEPPKTAAKPTLPVALPSLPKAVVASVAPVPMQAAVAAAPVKTSPRQRKRKVMEQAAHALECKIQSRRQLPGKIQFQESQSQEMTLESSENETKMDTSASNDDSQTSTVAMTTTSNSEGEMDKDKDKPKKKKKKHKHKHKKDKKKDTSSKDDESELARMIKQTAEDTKRMLDENSK